MSKTMKTNRVLLPLAAALFVIFTLAVVHEAGHALMAAVFGGRVTEFNVNFFNMGAHVRYSGNFSAGQRAAISAGGVGLSLAALWAFLLLAPRRTNRVMSALKLGLTVGVLGGCLVWVVLPLLSAYAGVQAGDDSVSFLKMTGIPAAWISLAGLGAVLATLGLYVRRTAPGERYLGLLRGLSGQEFAPADRRAVRVLAGILAAGMGLAAALGGFGGPSETQAPQPPENYRSAAVIDFSAGDVLGEPVAVIEVGERGKAGVFLALAGSDLDYLDVKLVGPGGFEQEILHAEGYTSSQDSAGFEAVLEPGSYPLLLTGRGREGSLEVFVLQPGAAD